MTKRERISSVDTAWLRMDRPTNLMMIVGVMIFDGRVDYERLKQVIQARFLRYRRFRQKAVEETTGYAWEDDEYFDLDSHLQRTALPGKGGKEELEKLAAELISSPLDPNKPLWHFQLVENYNGGSALIVRIHHCIADGIALIGVLLAMTDERADAPLHAATPDAEEPPEREEEPDNFWRQILQPVTDTVIDAINSAGAVWSKSISLVDDPSQLTNYVRIGKAVAAEVAQVALMPNDSPTRFKGRPGVIKRVAWSEPMPLAEIKAVGKVLGCSVNDVLLSSVAGALRGYLLDKGDDVTGVEIRALVPVNLRPAGQEHKLGNRFGLVALSLPVGVENPLARLYEVRRRMEELKGSYQAALTLGILGVVGMCPKPVQTQILDILAAKATAVMTNVPGPQKTLYLAGGRLVQQMFWVPQSGDVGMGVSILSYDGKVQFGLVADRKFVPDPQEIVARFQPEFEKVLLIVLMEPWDGRRNPRVVEEELAVAQGLKKPERHATAGKARKRFPVKTRAELGAKSNARRTRPTKASKTTGATMPSTSAAAAPGVAPEAEVAVTGKPARIPKRFR
jgi:WS/DGAT/MGAT family acyltransferase